MPDGSSQETLTEQWAIAKRLRHGTLTPAPPGSIPGSLVGAEPPHMTHFHVKSSSPTSGKLSKDRHKVRWALGFVAVVTLSAEKESQQAAR